MGKVWKIIEVIGGTAFWLFIACFFGGIIYGQCTKETDELTVERLLKTKAMVFAEVQDWFIKDVYICDTPDSKYYHTEVDCIGLDGCSGEFKTVARLEAREMMREPCDYCSAEDVIRLLKAKLYKYNYEKD